MYNNNFLPSITTSDLLTLVGAPLSTSTISNLFSKGFDTLNGVNLASSALDNLKNPNKEEDQKLKFKLPGYEKNEIKISIESGQEKYRRNRLFEPVGFLKVVIVAQNKEEGTIKYEGYFSQSIDESTIQAKLNNGILIITAKTDPKKSKEREIPIS